MRVTVRLLGGSHRSGGKLYADGDEFEVSRSEAEAFADKLKQLGTVTPAVGSAEHYASLKNLKEVYEAVEAGVFTPEQALEFEMLRSSPRAGAIERFTPADDDGNGGEKDQQDSGDGDGGQQPDGEDTDAKGDTDAGEDSEQTE